MLVPVVRRTIFFWGGGGGGGGTSYPTTPVRSVSDKRLRHGGFGYETDSARDSDQSFLGWLQCSVLFFLAWWSAARIAGDIRFCGIVAIADKPLHRSLRVRYSCK